MGDFGAISAGKAFIEYFIDDTQLGNKLAKIEQRLKASGAYVAYGLAAAAAGAATAAAVHFGESGTELEHLATKTGITVEKLSELKFAANQAGIDLEILAKAFKNLQANGIDPAQFDQIAADIRAIPDATARAEAAINIFGARTGQALLPMIEQLDESEQKARAFGVVMSGPAAQGAAEFWAALKQVRFEFGALADAVGAALVGPLTRFLKWLESTLATAIEFVHWIAPIFDPIRVPNINGVQSSPGFDANPGSDGSAVVARLDTLINIGRNGGLVAGIG